MKLATFSTGPEHRLGLVDPKEGIVRDLTGRLPTGVGMLELIDRWVELAPGLNRDAESLPTLALTDVTLCASIPAPRRNLFAVGKNYPEHAAEFGRSGYDTPSRSGELPEKPIVFSKVTTCVTGPGTNIDPHTGVTSELDYEAELAVIIGVGGRGITRDRALKHVRGYTILNDITARDLQRDHQQWLLGKSLDTHGPMGPWVVTADEIGDVTRLDVECRVNGERRQKASVADLIFDIPTLIETISAGITLLSGDIRTTGTPAGVGIGFTPPRFLTRGDVVEVSITGLGTLMNRIA